MLSTVLTSNGSKEIVIFCHGFRSSSIGPNRFFVRAARMLAEAGISSLRFDQYGSGNSEGDFLDSSFTDWIETIQSISKHYVNLGYEVALFGQSMGGSAVIVAASQVSGLNSVVSWSPDPSVDEPIGEETEYYEECGERVGNRFWHEAHNANIPSALSLINIPTYIVQCEDDEYVSPDNHQAIVSHARPNHVLEMYHGYPHSRWSFEQATQIIDRSVNFLLKNFRANTTAKKASNLEFAEQIIRQLKENGVECLLYGSAGVSIYLGQYKPSFSDIDLLVPDEWLESDWHKLQQIMSTMQYSLLDEHEHEFGHRSKPIVAFAKQSILTRDKIQKDESDIVMIPSGTTTLNTLSAVAFKRAYEFSSKDGYRIEKREKNDQLVIQLLNKYLKK